MPEDIDEMIRIRLRRMCGEGRPGVWIPPGLSIETLRETAKLAQAIENGPEQVATQGASINERQFTVVHGEPSGVKKYQSNRAFYLAALARGRAKRKSG